MGDPGTIAEGLAAFAEAGYSEVMVWLEPMDEAFDRPAGRSRGTTARRRREEGDMSPSGRRILAALFWLLASLGRHGQHGRRVGTPEPALRRAAGARSSVRSSTTPRSSTRPPTGRSCACPTPSTSRASSRRSCPGRASSSRASSPRASRTGSPTASRRCSHARMSQGALARVNAAAHDAAIAAIRGGGDVVSTEQGTITLNVFPLVGSVLEALQDAGVIDASRQIPGPHRVRAAGRDRGPSRDRARAGPARRHRVDRARRLRSARRASSRPCGRSTS